MLTKEEINRYSKQISLNEINTSGQERLKEARVLVIGAGGLGCPVIQYLAAAGVGVIGIVDFDTVELSNLQRQVIFSTHDIGESKAKIASEKITLLNPHVNALVYNTKFISDNATDIISLYDVVVDCTDNFETRYVINDTCVMIDKPFVYGGIYKFEGQMSVFNFQTKDGVKGPTYRCAFPDVAEDALMINCSLTGVIGTLPGIIGVLQANEVIKIITGHGEVCSGKILLYDSLVNIFTSIKIKRNEEAVNTLLSIKGK